ncbi:MAG: F0F1 ATP synthase subunit delta [Bacteroidaceae bacterium]|mgnify:CR=1 FL=1|nr:F0F1 ATP synthase subunit delta [Bacteroidaceae bacterium]
MDIGVISVRYARALLKSATQQNVQIDVYRDMQQLADTYIKLPKLRRTLDNPMLSIEQKESLLLAAAGKTPAELTKKFVALILKEGREAMMQFMANSYISLYRKQQNLISGRLITATPVAPDTEAKLRGMVEKRTSGKVEFKTEVSPDIIGGFILEYDTYRMDASVKSQLRNILNKLS